MFHGNSRKHVTILTHPFRGLNPGTGFNRNPVRDSNLDPNGDGDWDGNMPPVHNEDADDSQVG
jgi:hypothetical protein